MKTNPPSVEKIGSGSQICFYPNFVLSNFGYLIAILDYLAVGDRVFFVSFGNKE